MTFDFAETLVALRRRNKLTTRALALKAGVSQKTVTFWENGRSKPGVVELSKLAIALDVDFVDLARTVPGVEVHDHRTARLHALRDAAKSSDDLQELREVVLDAVSVLVGPDGVRYATVQYRGGTFQQALWGNDLPAADLPVAA